VDDLARLGCALLEASAAAEAHGCLPKALVGLTPMAFVALMFTGRELLLLALDQEIKNSAI
jgi:hypothetical protein